MVSNIFAVWSAPPPFRLVAEKIEAASSCFPAFALESRDVA